jgi:hypothetical protein
MRMELSPAPLIGDSKIGLRKRFWLGTGLAIIYIIIIVVLG